jgi:hypothetical protein
MEQELPAGSRKRQVAGFVQDNEVHTGQVIGDPTLAPGAALRVPGAPENGASRSGTEGVYLCFGGFATRFERAASERGRFPPRDMGRVTFAIGAFPLGGLHENALVGELVNERPGLVDP